MIRELRGMTETSNIANSKYNSLIVKEYVTNKEIINYFQKITSLELKFKNPIIEFLFVEGNTNKKVANSFVKELSSIFKINYKKAWILPELQNFNNHKLKIFRALNTIKEDKNEIYISGFRIGKLDAEKYAYYTLLVKFMEQEASEYLKNIENYSYQAHVIMKRVGDEFVISLWVMGAKALIVEKPVESFFRYCEQKLKNINFNELENLKEKNRVEFETPITNLHLKAESDHLRIYNSKFMGINIFKEDCAKALRR